MRRVLICLLAMVLAGCATDVVFSQDSPEIVVEGWIEDGGFPVVIVTTSVPVSTDYKDWDTLMDHLVRWAKVSISDGEKEVILTGKMDTDYFPPYIYTTARMRGEAGKKYSLKVEYGGRTETAETTIPSKVPLEYVKVLERTDGYGIVAGLKDNTETKDYYKFFTMVEGVDSTYVSSFLGLVDDVVLGEEVTDIAVNSTFVSNFNTIERSQVSYEENDVVRVRFVTMDETSFNYWSDYDDVTMLSTNPFFPVNKKIRSNISSGMGYWAGYGSTYYRVSIADSLALGRFVPLQ